MRTPATAKSSELIYGHFGLPEYDQLQHKWHFPRCTDLAPRLVAQSTFKTILDATVPQNSGWRGRTDLSAQARELVKENLEFSALEGLLEDGLMHEFAAIETSNFDDIKSELLSATSISTVSGNGWSCLPLLAVATGPCGEIVRVLPGVRSLDVGSLTDCRSGSSTYQTGLDRNGLWVSPGGPVLQITCRATNQPENQCLLGVRLERSVYILQVVLHEQPQSITVGASSKAAFFIPPSTITLQCIAECIADPLLESSFLDVTFSTEYENRFATTSQSGRCQAWELSPTNTSTISYRDGCKRLAIFGTGANDADLPLSDWCRARWVGTANATKLIIATRASVSIANCEPSMQDYIVPGLNLQSSSEIILDLQTDTQRPLVASTMTCAVELSWKHYRNPEDLSLRISLCLPRHPLRCGSEADNAARADTILVVLYSKLTGLLSIFTFHCDVNASRISSVSDPYNLPELYSTVSLRKSNHETSGFFPISSILLTELSQGSFQRFQLSALGASLELSMVDLCPADSCENETTTSVVGEYAELFDKSKPPSPPFEVPDDPFQMNYGALPKWKRRDFCQDQPGSEGMVKSYLRGLNIHACMPFDTMALKTVRSEPPDTDLSRQTLLEYFNDTELADINMLNISANTANVPTTAIAIRAVDNPDNDRLDIYTRYKTFLANLHGEQLELRRSKQLSEDALSAVEETTRLLAKEVVLCTEIVTTQSQPCDPWPIPDSTPDEMKALLDEWQVGADPSSHDYIRLMATLEPQALDSNDNSTGPSTTKSTRPHANQSSTPSLASRAKARAAPVLQSQAPSSSQPQIQTARNVPALSQRTVEQHGIDRAHDPSRSIATSSYDDIPTSTQPVQGRWGDDRKRARSSRAAADRGKGKKRKAGF